MFRFVSIAVLLLVGAYASNFNQFDNFIDYRDRPIHGYGIPYAYQPPKNERVIVKKVSPYLDNGLGHFLVPEGLEQEVNEVEDSKPGLDTSIISVTFGVIKKAVVFLFYKIPALIFGTLIALGVCHFTAICGKLSALETLIEAKREIRSLATPERVAAATEFVQNAIRKYRSLQDAE